VIVVFHTAWIVRVVSEVVAVVIELVAASPTARLQPPKVYPVLVVAAVLDRDRVATASVSLILLAVSVAGTEVASELPLKIIVGVDADVALAGTASTTKLDATNADAIATLTVFLVITDPKFARTLIIYSLVCPTMYPSSLTPLG